MFPDSMLMLIDMTARYASHNKEAQRADTEAFREEFALIYMQYINFKRGPHNAYFEETNEKLKRGRPSKADIRRARGQGPYLRR